MKKRLDADAKRRTAEIFELVEHPDNLIQVQTSLVRHLREAVQALAEDTPESH